MAYKTLIFGVDDLFNELNPYYVHEVQRGNLEIAAFAVLEGGKVTLVPATDRPEEEELNFELAIISSRNDFYNRMKFLESQGIPRNRIIDGSIFKMPNLDFPRLLVEGVAYGTFDKNSFEDISFAIYPRIYVGNGAAITFDTKSYIAKRATVDGFGIISVDKFSSLSWNITFELGLNSDHNKKNVGQYGWSHFDWTVLRISFRRRVHVESILVQTFG